VQIVEFYAPWCGHCRNLQPAYEKAAKSLAGLAKVAAIDCDDDANKPFCGQMGVQGFPTLKIVRPGSKPGRPAVEDYMGPRTAKGIVEAVKDKIPNHVKKLQGKALDEWLRDSSIPAKVIVFNEKGTTSPLVKSLAIDFLGTIAFAQVRDKTTAEKHGVVVFPSLHLIPSPDGAPIPFNGEINRESLLAFFSQVATPNPDPAPKGSKSAKSSGKKQKPKASSSASAAFSRASEAHKASDFEDHLAGSSTIILDDMPPTESPLPIVETKEKPMIIEDAIAPVPTLTTPAEVRTSCLTPKSGNCMLLLLAGDSDELSTAALTALASFAEIMSRYNKRKAHAIPVYAVPAENQAAKQIRNDLDLGTGNGLEIIATNLKRGWWRRYQSDSYDVVDLEKFVDAIKLGEGSKQKLPAGFGELSEASAVSEADVPNPEPESEAIPHSKDAPASGSEPQLVATPAIDHEHDEL
jgi:protein disulfide-isomerase A6